MESVNPTFGQQLTNSLQSGVSSLVGGLPSALASGVLNMIGSNIQYKRQQDTLQKQMDWQEKMQDKANQFSEDIWNKQNAYNDPSAQLQRMRDAGLNPIFYGLDGSSAGGLQSASVGSIGTPSYENPFAGASNSLDQAAMTGAKAFQAFASASASYSDADYKSALTVTENAMRDGKLRLLGTEINLGIENVKLSQKQQDEITARIAETEANTRKIQADIDIAWSNLDLNKQRYALEQAKFEFEKWLDTQNLSLRERALAIDMYNSETNRLVGKAGAALSEAQKDFTIQKTATEEALTSKAEKETELYEKYGEKITKQGIRGQKAANFKAYTSSACDVVDEGLKVFGAVITGGLSTVVNFNSSIE
ncbi:minor capsid protein [Capybara microvirus Cap1_SP_87]|nr:minor capsid protein [Capybara microvirus Cap1_SP_87]